jgi:hypothetical protein
VCSRCRSMLTPASGSGRANTSCPDLRPNGHAAEEAGRIVRGVE